jgi:hypothetical protein
MIYQTKSQRQGLREVFFLRNSMNVKIVPCIFLLPFLKYIFGIWERGLAISSGYILPTVKLEIFFENIYFYKLNTYFRGTVMHLQ